MTLRFHGLRFVTALFVAAVCAPVRGADWPMWGGTTSRNMVSTERGLPDTFAAPEAADAGNAPPTQPATGTTNLKWITTVGSQSYGNPTVAGGRIFLGTNNDPPHQSAREGDFGVVLCLDETTGKLIWQLTSPKLAAGDVSDFEHVGNCSSPTVVADRVYVVTNRCEVLCLDVQGLANGNQGPFTDEGRYIAGSSEKAADLLPTDADILWIYDLRDELGVFPNQMTSSSVLCIDGRLYVTTSNGRDWTNVHMPSPNAPALICLDAQTGKLLGQERSGISGRTFKCNWSSPSYGVVDGRPMVFFGGDDGICYAFDPVPPAGVDGIGTLREIWRFDCNPPEYRSPPGGTPFKYGHPRSPSGILATPVFHDGKVYIAIGQDPGQGEGIGALVCINAAAGTGDVTKTAQVWMNKQIGRSLSTVAIGDGLLYAADIAGKVYCLDVQTGAEIWKHDAEGAIWGSPLLADGKIYIGTETQSLWVLSAGREKRVLNTINVHASVFSTPVAANGALYVLTGRALLAAQKR